MQTTDLDRSTRPGKWIKRGVQPEVEPSRKSILVSLAELAASIREEADPHRKAELEAQYAADTKALDALTCDPTSTDLKTALAEIADCFTPIVDPPADIAEELEMPETMTRDQWQHVHSRILQCNRASNRWLSKSRRFATERWGDAYVAECEQQMEMALGLEPKPLPLPPPDTSRDIVLAESINKTFLRWVKVVDLDHMTQTRAEMLLAQLEPVADMVRKLRRVAG
jgi:hypothetical protein